MRVYLKMVRPFLILHENSGRRLQYETVHPPKMDKTQCNVLNVKQYESVVKIDP